jgi:hypothetical protein
MSDPIIQHLIHHCQYDHANEGGNLGLCGAQTQPGVPGVEREKCPDCSAMIGTVSTCAGCGETGLVEA